MTLVDTSSMHALPEVVGQSPDKEKTEALIRATNAIGRYRLVLKQGEPFVPVNLRVHKDPISLIEKILEQNPQSYTKITDLIDIGLDMVHAGLLDDRSKTSLSQPLDGSPDSMDTTTKRVQAYCIMAALKEDDFETAYSYIMTRLSVRNCRAQKPTLSLECEDDRAIAETPPIINDDWSWRAAFQAGRYQPNNRTVKPTHIGNASGNLEIRHLQQRLECISLTLRIAPPPALHEVLSVFRKCEESLDAILREEAEADAEWDARGDDTTMPGGFGPEKKNATLSRKDGRRAGEEEPISIFDLTKASAARAQNTISALAGLNASTTRSVSAANEGFIARQSSESARDASMSEPKGRKRDQLRDAAVGTLATGVGWLIGAPPPSANSGPDDISSS
jgi:hypothetical protein